MYRRSRFHRTKSTRVSGVSEAVPVDKSKVTGRIDTRETKVRFILPSFCLWGDTCLRVEVSLNEEERVGSKGFHEIKGPPFHQEVRISGDSSGGLVCTGPSSSESNLISTVSLGGRSRRDIHYKRPSCDFP